MTFQYSARSIFILGEPRSGTTWLAKIFDSHPDVLYLHEPDARNQNLPSWVEPEQFDALLPQAQTWLDELVAGRSFSSVGKKPVFPKSYVGPAASAFKRILLSSIGLAWRSRRIFRHLERMRIPDFFDLDSDTRIRIVIKSVRSLGRAGVIMRASPDSRLIIPLRHPCGEIASVIRAVALSQFSNHVPIENLAQTQQARRRALTADALAKLSLHEQLAWSWVIRNEKAMEDVRGARYVKVIRYEDLAADPETTAKDLFRFCDLEWSEQTSQFLLDSGRASGPEHFFEVSGRDALKAATKWKQELSQSEIDAVCAIAAQSIPGRISLAEDAPRLRAASDRSDAIYGNLSEA